MADVVPAGNIGLKLRLFPQFFDDVEGDRNFGFGICCFEKSEKRSESSCPSRYTVSMVIQISDVSL